MEQLKSWEAKRKVYAIIGILSALLCVGNLFMPFLSGDLSSLVESLRLGNIEIFGLYPNGISLVGYAVACIYAYNTISSALGSVGAVFLVGAVFVGIIALFSLINLIAALCKKPVLSMVFSIFIFIITLLELGFYYAAGLLESTVYSAGAALYIYIACFIVTFVIDILLIVANKKIKKIKVENNIN